MTNKLIPYHKRFAMGQKTTRYAKGGGVSATPKKDLGGAKEVADDGKPTLKSRAGVEHKPTK